MHHFLMYTFISIYRSDDLNLREDLLDSLHVVNLELFFSIIFFSNEGKWRDFVFIHVL